VNGRRILSGVAATHWDTPPGYRVLSYCTSCGCDFASDTLFDRHRTGTHDYTYSEGAKMDPPREDGRRCLTRDEMRAKGWRPFTDKEMLASKRDRHRVGYGVELWGDPKTRLGVGERLRGRTSDDTPIPRTS
jgi:hypothetical protein